MDEKSNNSVTKSAKRRQGMPRQCQGLAFGKCWAAPQFFRRKCARSCRVCTVLGRHIGHVVLLPSGACATGSRLTRTEGGTLGTLPQSYATQVQIGLSLPEFSYH